MQAIVALLFFLAQSASPSPAATVPSPDWTKVPAPDADTFAAYTRQAPSGTRDFLSASRRVCDCRVDDVVGALSGTLKSVPGAVVDERSTTVCGEPARQLTATGIASGSQKNVELLAFRDTNALVVIQLAFSAPAPTAQDEASMRALCPGASPAAA